MGFGMRAVSEESKPNHNKDLQCGLVFDRNKFYGIQHTSYSAWLVGT